MNEKKSDRRFTIQFSRTDPKQLQAAKILNQYERFGKAQYLADAILYYENRNEAPGQQSTKIDEKYIESMINRILHDKQTSGIPSISGNENNRKPSDSIEYNDSLDAIGEDGFNAIAGALNMFKKNNDIANTNK